MPHLKAGDLDLEYTWYGPPPAEAPTIVFLHEGLGCVQMWRDFPQQVAETVGCSALIYSRAGYGNSDPISLPRPVRFMHDEALITLPQVLDAIEVQEAILFGHSDGGSIALIYAGSGKAQRVRGLVLEAPHVFVEEFGLASIRAIRQEYEEGTLKQRLERYHGKNVDNAFWGWHEVWLNPEFRSWNIEEYLSHIEVPALLIQGEDDQYGTLAQLERIQRGCRGKVRTTILPNCGHTPHRDQPELTLRAVTSFLKEEFLRSR
jgi:pimeloyl-ACP methyl ester carboxylesterase